MWSVMGSMAWAGRCRVTSNRPDTVTTHLGCVPLRGWKVMMVIPSAAPSLPKCSATIPVPHDHGPEVTGQGAETLP